MWNFPSLFKIKRDKITLVLDIGTEAVKALIFQEKEEKKGILGSSLEYFDYFGTPGVQNTERDIFEKVILKTFTNLNLQSLRLKFDVSVILGLSADISKARVISQSFNREKPEKIIDGREEREIFQRITEEARKKTCQIHRENSGILAEDLEIYHLKISGIKIDGYEVPTLQKYSGRNLDFRVLTTLSVKRYPKEIEDICRTIGLPVRGIVHQAQGLASYFRGKTDSILLDIGGETTQIFVLRAGKLEAVNELKIGGKAFSQALSERLGLRLSESRIFKERYSRKELSEESSERIKEILYFACQSWFKGLKSKLREMNPNGLLPQDIILFGGGSQLPEVLEILKNGSWEKPFSNTRALAKGRDEAAASSAIKPGIKFFQPTELKTINDGTKNLNNPQYIPVALLYCSSLSEGGRGNHGLPRIGKQ